jgi:ABC-type bacteriocin/lantibiotic exporter with double-glycine peptidase domain
MFKIGTLGILSLRVPSAQEAETANKNKKPAPTKFSMIWRRYVGFDTVIFSVFAASATLVLSALTRVCAATDCPC